MELKENYLVVLKRDSLVQLNENYEELEGDPVMKVEGNYVVELKKYSFVGMENI
jgi:hypothetical protein